ncbi:hypothetical protein ACF3DV_32030 [Chlorogloeopsis fritschii PCC 9212]|jgi:hypothetical protein|uniref:KOW domain-containing protein n=1 Tax=Chlorogloeopsis fritschii PCC 6912 TaxID=211165 RepID=A0A433NM93_CHLFR|nr:hypothetical protein [Chlorogloeopsis fritschii]MBF2008055.1 hypothetical protein [Chlorogloeopsis fritschii C42_A2020_084]RUR84155.1 hypothetical protein PCC6912_17490 [Chlorogloeopsis fritschii PCC 6912]
MQKELFYRIGQKVYVSEPRMPQYGKWVTIRGTSDGHNLGTFLVCRDDKGNKLLLRESEVSISKPVTEHS